MENGQKSESVPEQEDVPSPGSLFDLPMGRHLLVGYVGQRALLNDARTHHPWLVQEADGSLQLPMTASLKAMLHSGEARPVQSAGPAFTHTEKLSVEIDLLDANGISQGDKAIWQFLVRAWTADLIARFGPHDDPCRIRRWRADLRKAAKEQLPDAHSSVITDRCR
ncbi:hypothetical protein [Sphingomonas sp. PvP018]|uniref:hypothetical protein n=1 Tax=Sphingomonas sp. PvP018 TaxID=2817852 RepID=UPI001AEA7BBE|nr:hypothetical protein [Sphingomonas sp. PvP018]MBP2513764.1 hypothetical protein [Sphingomonas sp. PvP018]